MDQNMPVMDGCTAAMTIRELLFEKGIDQPIICGVTGQTDQEYVAHAISSGMNLVYSKPLDYVLV